MDAKRTVLAMLAILSAVILVAQAGGAVQAAADEPADVATQDDCVPIPVLPCYLCDDGTIWCHASPSTTPSAEI